MQTKEEKLTRLNDSIAALKERNTFLESAIKGGRCLQNEIALLQREYRSNLDFIAKFEAEREHLLTNKIK